jgi:transposase
MKVLNIANIRIDGGTQARIALNQDVVKDYAEKMRDGEKFPEITVFFDGSSYWLADGFHRYFATKSNGTVSIEAEVKTGTQDDAIFFAWGANGKRGLSLTAEDHRNIIYAMLRHPEYQKMTNAAIAKHVGVSKMTVGRVKATLETKDEDTVKTYTDRHGNEVKVDTDKLKTKKANPKTTKPDMSTGDLNPFAEYEEKINELTDTIIEQDKENQVLRDQIALGQWDASDIEKIDVQDTITELREQIRILEIDNKSLRESRDMFQNRNAELMRTLKTTQNKLKKFVVEA